MSKGKSANEVKSDETDGRKACINIIIKQQPLNKEFRVHTALYSCALAGVRALRVLLRKVS